MSFTDPAVQPEGQGGQPTGGDAPYQQYLNEIPEEHRGLVEPAFRRWDGDVTRRFQEASEFRQQWAPLAEAGYTPDALAPLIEFAQMAQNEEQFKAWLAERAQTYGLLEQQPAGGEDDDLYSSDPEFQAALSKALSPLQQELEALRSWRSEQELNSYQSQAQAEIDQHLDALAKQHGDVFNRDAVEKFIPNYIGNLSAREAIDRAFADYKSLLGQIEQQFVNRKTGQPDPPVVPGATATQPPAVLSREEARAAATRMLRAGRQQQS